ncbi:MAG TPA: DsbA family protein [Steroidobacteraceae bacterium]|nr:DsbA family protein [Steroidobacteraceae bacterium]
MRLTVEATDHVQGPDHATTTVIEYGDFECPTCKLAAAPVKMLLDRFPQQIRFVFRHFPLEEPHPHALLAAEAAESAGAQGRFWEMHDMLFSHQAHLKLADLLRYGTELGLDVARYKNDLDDHIYLQRVREHIADGRRLHLRATPTFFVNGVLTDVSFGMGALHEAVVQAVQQHH